MIIQYKLYIGERSLDTKVDFSRINHEINDVSSLSMVYKGVVKVKKWYKFDTFRLETLIIKGSNVKS